MPPFAEEDTLRNRPKNYRLSEWTIVRLEAIHRLRPRQFLDYDEEIAEIVRFYLAHQKTLSEEVERDLAERAAQTEGEPEVAAVRVRSRSPETEDPR